MAPLVSHHFCHRPWHLLALVPPLYAEPVDSPSRSSGSSSDPQWLSGWGDQRTKGTPTRRATTNTQRAVGVARPWRNWGPVLSGWECKMVQHRGRAHGVPQNTTQRLTDSATPLLGVPPKELNTGTGKGLQAHAHSSIATTARRWKTGVSTEAWMAKK